LILDISSLSTSPLALLGHQYNYCILKASKSDSIYTVLEDAEIEDVISCIKGSYIKGYRHNLVFGLSGYTIFMNNISLSSVEKLVSSLCDYTRDEEKASRLSVVSNTYH
jgi:hypothetical protein